MDDLPNRVTVAPIADLGTNRRDALNRQLQLSGQEQLVLISMGGIASRLPIEDWPRMAGVRYLVQASWQADHPDAIVFDALPFSFSDLLASCDVLLCKPGYGSFVEASSCGVPLLYVGRPDWPESPALTDWLKQHGISREITPEAIAHGDFAAELQQLCSANRPAPAIPDGARQAAAWLANRIG
ncbi:MAG: hypothetical protein PHF75_01460 [Gallionella sp.]|nr:hypothetical protein [Gallionella sp.]